MRVNLAIIAVFLVGTFAFCSNSVSYAQEEDVEYTYGVVANVSAGQITIEEYDYDKDEDVEQSYSIDAATEFENVESAEEIAAGDYVDIDYITKSGKRIAKAIIVEKETLEEPTGEEEAAEEEPAEEITDEITEEE